MKYRFYDGSARYDISERDAVRGGFLCVLPDARIEDENAKVVSESVFVSNPRVGAVMFYGDYYFVRVPRVRGGPA